MTSRIMLPVDGSDASLRAVEHVIKAAAGHKTQPEIHLLNVQPALPKFVSRAQLDTYHRDEGMKALQPARAKLDAAGLKYDHHIGVGEEPAQVIASYVKDKKCDQLVMGTRGLGSVAGALLGSVTTKTLHLVGIPVLLVR
jgi:nucleotide-binding universal stress UspA family protein